MDHEFAESPESEVEQDQRGEYHGYRSHRHADAVRVCQTHLLMFGHGRIGDVRCERRSAGQLGEQDLAGIIVCGDASDRDVGLLVGEVVGHLVDRVASVRIEERKCNELVRERPVDRIGDIPRKRGRVGCFAGQREVCVERALGFGTFTEKYGVGTGIEPRAGVAFGNPVRIAFAARFEHEVATGEIHFRVSRVAQLDPRDTVAVGILVVVAVFD